jgi:hypothetical protein
MNDVFIGISTYNEMSMVEQQLVQLSNSIRGVSGEINVELRYFDDGSTPDNYAKLIESADRFNVKISRFPHSGFGGIHQEMQDCIGNAEYGIFLDSDVLVPLDFVAQIYTLLKLGKEDLGILSCISHKVVYGASYPFGPDSHMFSKKPELATQLASYCFAFESKKYIECRGVNSEYLAYFCDSDLCCRFAANGYKNYRIYSPFVVHAEHTTMKSNKNNFDLKALRDHDKKIFLNNWGDTPESMEKHFLKEWRK